MTKSQLKVILIVEHVHQVSIEWMDVIELREAVNYGTELLIDSGLCEFDLSHVELSYSRDFELVMDLCGCFPVSLRQYYVNQFVGVWNRGNSFEVVPRSGVGHRY